MSGGIGGSTATLFSNTRRLVSLLSYTLAFCLFWISTALLSVLVRLAPPLRRRPRIARRIVSGLLRAFCSVIRVLGVIKVRVSGNERAPVGPCVIAANHPTLIDALVLMSVFPSAICVVKGELAASRVLRPLIEALGHLVVTDATLISNCVTAVERGGAVLVFPEGTRSRPGEVGPLRRGAATISLRSGAPLLPVVVRATPPTLGKGQRWRELPAAMVDLEIRVCYPLPPLDGRNGEDERVAARRLTEQLEALFRNELRTDDQLTAGITEIHSSETADDRCGATGARD